MSLWGLKFVVLSLSLFGLSEQGGFNIPEGNFVVEVYFAVDEKCLEKYLVEENNNKKKAIESLERDVLYFITEVNKLYTTLYKTKVQIKILKVKILSGNVYKSEHIQQGTSIHEDNALNDWDAWLKSQGLQASMKYDIAILFTGYDIGNAQSMGTAGYAHVGTVCKGELASGVVEYTATYQTVVTTAHEIAHILGALHDTQASAYVMAPVSKTSNKNRWYFSLCSASNTWDVINNINGKNNCLLKTSASSVLPNVKVTSKLENPAVICARTYGAGYYLNHQLRQPYGDEVCQSMFCGTKGNAIVQDAIASDGMPCGIRKTCQFGTCKPDSSSTAASQVTDDKCVFGDQKYITNQYKTCGELLAMYKAFNVCRWPWYIQQCCGTMKSVKCSKKKRDLDLVDILLDKEMEKKLVQYKVLKKPEEVPNPSEHEDRMA